jgi:predicted phage baseplate assembly protein
MRLAAPEPEAAASALRLTWAGINAARMVQAANVVDELLGVGNGEPDQSFILANTPVLPRSVSLVGRLPGGTAVRWRPSDDLLAASSDDPVFELDPEAGTVRFGDGLRGARPPRDMRLLATYRYGGGAAGNVAIGAVNRSRDARLQGGFRIANPVPASGGAAGETVAEGERNIPRVVRHRERLVTPRDFRDIALRAEEVDVGRVEVLPLYRPGEPPQTDAAGSVTLLAVPRFDPLKPLWPTPDRPFLRRLCDYLDERRLVTTEIHVRGPDYIPLYLTLGIRVAGDFFADTVRAEAIRRLRVYLSSLPPGGSDGRGWGLAKPVLAKDLEAVATRVAGVEYVQELHLGEAGPVERERIDLEGLQLPLLAAIEVSIGAALPLSALLEEPPEAPPPGTRAVPVPVVEETC